MDTLYERTDFLDRLCQEYLNTFNMIRRLMKDLANAIRGTLVSKKVGKYTYFDHQIWEKGKRTRTYVKKKDEQALRQKIELRQFQERQLKALKAYLAELRKSLRHFRVKAETIVEEYRRRRQARAKEEKEKWIARKAADEKPYRENLRYRTLKGDYVRSKSELALSNLLFSLGIKYTYGAKVILGGVEREADFFVESRLDRRKQYYWEHCGMMDDPEYRRKFREKMEAYHAEGYREGKDLIVTYEDRNSGLDMMEMLTVLVVNRIL